MQLFSFDGKETLKAQAEMSGEEITGKAEFIEYEFGDQKVVKIVLELEGNPEKIKPGKHAVHIPKKGIVAEDLNAPVVILIRVPQEIVTLMKTIRIMQVICQVLPLMIKARANWRQSHPV